MRKKKSITIEIKPSFGEIVRNS